MEGPSLATPDNTDQRPASISTIAWFAAVLLTTLIPSQIIRLHYSDAGNWIFWDYAGRLAALAMLAALPAARALAFRSDKRQMPLWKISFWIVGIVLVARLSRWLSLFINNAFPTMVLGVYPRLSGWLYLIDLIFGLALVAVSEEIIFRRYARRVLQPYLGNGIAALAATSLVFGCYHWWVGLGSVVTATILGALLMLMFKRSVALWPVALAHYSVDIISFT
jgi:membrane protease YdiL (CAAX protease family)